MEIDITEFAAATAWDFSHSVAEGGNNAGRNTWNAAKAYRPDMLKTDEARGTFRKYLGTFGAWDDAEIAAFTDEELNALLVQMIAGDIREAGFDALEEIDWKKYEAASVAGLIAGNLHRSDDGRYFYTGDEY